MNISKNIPALGNDLVDLRDRDSLGVLENERFLRRVFTEFERETIFSNNDKEAFRRAWLLWAAKEASYKALKQISPNAVFSPIAFEVDLAGGVTNYPGCKFLLDTFIEPGEYVHVMALLPHEWREAGGGGKIGAASRGFEGVISKVDLIEEVQGRAVAAGLQKGGVSEATRYFCLETARPHLGTQSGELTLEKYRRPGELRGVPRFCLDGEPLPVRLSASHHGRYCAVAFSM